MDKRARIFLVALLLLAAIGFSDSFIIHEKIAGVIQAPCIIGKGCDTVLYSYYSKLFGISLAWWGLAFYTVYLISVMAVLLLGHRRLFQWLVLLIGAGFLFSLYLFYIQVFALGAICTYCMISFSDLLLSAVFLILLVRALRQRFLQS